MNRYEDCKSIFLPIKHGDYVCVWVLFTDKYLSDEAAPNNFVDFIETSLPISCHNIANFFYK